MQVSVKKRLGKVAVTKYGEYVTENVKITAVPFNSIDSAMYFSAVMDYASGSHVNFALAPLNDNPMDFDEILELNPQLNLFNESRVIFDWVDSNWLTGQGTPII